MTDGVIKNTGNSRYLKTVSNALTQYSTYAGFMRAMAAGTFPIDVSGINSAGWSVQGTKLNKASLLKDATAVSFGKTSVAVPDDIFKAIKGLFDTQETKINVKCGFDVGTYTGTGIVGSDSESTKCKHTFSIVPQLVLIGSGGTGTSVKHNIAILFPNAGFGRVSLNGGDNTSGLVVSQSGKTVTWYQPGLYHGSSQYANWQMNKEGLTYYCFAIG